MNLIIYPVILELVRQASPELARLRVRSSELGDQLERALTSIPLNTAEGAYSRGRNRQARYQSAAASAREALACFEAAQALGWAGAMDSDLVALFNRVIGTLVRLSKSAQLSEAPRRRRRSPRRWPWERETVQRTKDPLNAIFERLIERRQIAEPKRHFESRGALAHLTKRSVVSSSTCPSECVSSL